ncbi:sugar O-acetyltransferase [Helicobacter himalayensis]|uniref:sugar O-acetyltransferase n=1 Tax=Helicobacter himalayensis TaxID=1591088 RepID=UPI003D6F973D
MKNANEMDIFARDLAGLPVDSKEKDFGKILEIIHNAQKLIAKLNTGYHSPESVREILSELFGVRVDESCWILPPFYTDFGRNIGLGKNVFINQNCTFMDRGGITIGDESFIGPRVNLVTINHDFNPHKRTITYCKPINIGPRVWIGVAATICAGVSVGEGSIIGAGAVVTKDVPSGVIVAGNPARVIREIGKNFTKE